MSEKHLTESPWKVLVAKQGVKDIGLGKALAAYAKVDGTKELGQGLEALKEISELALKLKKTCASKQDVMDHLDEVIKEVKRTLPGLEAKAKTAEPAVKAGAAKPEEEKEEDEEEQAEKDAAEFKKDLKSQMVSALAQVKMRAPGGPEQQKEPKPQLKFMAYIVGKACAVVVARKVGAATKKLLPDITNVAGVGHFVQGECVFEKNTHTFVLDKVPGGLAKKLATALQAETGQKCKTRARTTDGSVELDSDTDVDPDAAGAPAPAAPADSAAGTARFTARFKALQPALLKAIAAKTPEGDEAKQRAAEAVGMAKKNNFAQANRLLDLVDILLQETPADVTPPPPPAPPPPAATAAGPQPPKPPPPPAPKAGGPQPPAPPPLPGAAVAGGPPPPMPPPPPGSTAQAGAPGAPSAPPGPPGAPGAPKPPGPLGPPGAPGTPPAAKPAVAAAPGLTPQQKEEAATKGRIAARKQQAALDHTLKDREADREKLKETLSKADIKALKAIESGDGLVTASGTFQAIDPGRKNSGDALASLGGVASSCKAWVEKAGQAKPKPDAALVKRVKAMQQAAEQEQQRLTVIRQAVATLATPDPDFATTGEWNKTGGVRIKSIQNMPSTGKHAGPPDGKSPERLADTKRQVEKFNLMLEEEVSRSDAFAQLLAEAMSEEGGKSFTMYVGKGTAGAWDDYDSLGVDVDDLDCLPKDPVPTADGSTKGGVTKGEIMAHVLEERMYGYKGETPAAYIDAHQLCLSPGSYQNQHRRELGIPADSIVYDNCKHSHTKEGYACFEGLDSQGVKTIVHDMPTDLKGNNKALKDVSNIKVPDSSKTEVVREFADEAATYDALISKTMLIAKSTLFGSKEAFDWKKPDAQNMLHFITCAEKGDEKRIEARKTKIKAELDAYHKSALSKAVLNPELEAEKQKAAAARAKASSPAELAVEAERAKRPAVVNTGASADGATNCAMCTLGAILNLSSEEAAIASQKLCGKQKPDSKMQSEKLFFNSYLGMDDNTPDEPGTRLPVFEAQLGKPYMDEVKKRLAAKGTLETDPKFWARFQGEITGDFQFEGLRLMLEEGIAKRNKKSKVEFEVVQDGLPTEGKMYPWKDLNGQMRQYPDGTQFQVFVRGAAMPGHWVYADKVAGNVLFEDYQKNCVKVVETQSVVIPKDVAAAKRDFSNIWARVTKEQLADFKKQQSMEPDEDLNAVQEKNFFQVKVLPAIKAASATKKEEFVVPNSAYVASETNSPRHPQSDKADVFEEGMFLAIVPKKTKKPQPKDSTTIKSIRDLLSK